MTEPLNLEEVLLRAELDLAMAIVGAPSLASDLVG
jgi:hypothetical protein